MARPKPTILLEFTDPRTYKCEQILAASAIYAVYYENQPINLRSLNNMVGSSPKYKTVSFSNSGHAFNLADRLNELFDTTSFTVVKLNHGEIIKEDESLRHI